MSKATENAFKEMQKTQFRFVKPTVIEVTNAAILWPDFTGKVTKYHKTLGAQRSFNLAITDEMLVALSEFEQMHGVKFNIHEVNVYSDNDVENKDVQQQIIRYINVKVNVGNGDGSATATLFTEYNGKKSRTTLTADTIGTLDTADLESADVQINLYTSPAYPESCSMYLRKIYCIQSPQQPEFNGKYDEYFDEEGNYTATDAVVKADTIINFATGDVM